MPISEKNLKILWGRAAGRCSFPLCNTVLIQEGTKNDAPVVVGEIAHIVARSPYGPRGKESLLGTDRDSLENLILLCPVHHRIIDEQPQTYTLEVLTQMKNQHEQYMKAQNDLYSRISASASHYQTHVSASHYQINNSAPIQGIAIGEHNAITNNYYHPMGTDSQQSHKVAKQERLRKHYNTILYCAKVHYRILKEMKSVMEGETAESRNARHFLELNASNQGIEKTVSDLELEQPEASEVLPIFNTFLNAFHEYASLLNYNNDVSGSFSGDEIQTALKKADTAYSQLQAICVKHLAP